jgi:hypothetical protein
VNTANGTSRRPAVGSAVTFRFPSAPDMAMTALVHNHSMSSSQPLSEQSLYRRYPISSVPPR